MENNEKKEKTDNKSTENLKINKNISTVHKENDKNSVFNPFRCYEK